jgi:hypothetical protein
MVTLCTATGKRVRHYGHREVVLSFTRYPRNGRICVRLVALDHGVETETCAACTVNLPAIEMADNEIAIKTWHENVGMLDWLIDHGIISAPIRYAFFGSVFIPICELLVTGDGAPAGDAQPGP